MCQSSTISLVVRGAVILACAITLIGCTSSSGSDVIDPGTNEKTGGVDGSWDYLITNAFNATFINCTGDASVLEGATYTQAEALVPMCKIAVRFDVNQIGDAFQVIPHEVQCSDGSMGSVGGIGAVGGQSIGGQWESTSGAGVSATQVFEGLIDGDTIQVTETERIFSGAIQGNCIISPPLTALVTVG